MYMFLSCAEMTGLWGLVNNAGILYLLPIEWTSMNIFKRTADVNLWGMIDVTKTFLPLIKKTHGRVVNLSSIAGTCTYASLSTPGTCALGLSHNLENTLLGLMSNDCVTSPQSICKTGYTYVRVFLCSLAGQWMTQGYKNIILFINQNNYLKGRHALCKVTW